MQGKAPKKQGKTVSPRSGADVTGYQFKPGVSGNPRGAKKLTEEEKKTREQLRLLTVKTAHALEKVVKDQGAEASEVLAQLVWKAANGGNFAPLLSLWRELQNRTLGKPREFHEVVTEDRTLGLTVDERKDFWNNKLSKAKKK